jgi:4-hydroxybenzoyl-CoA reductase subunit beta
MRLPRFEYFEPATIEEACALLSRPETRVLAGGTELQVHMKQKTVTPKALVNIKHIPGLDHIEQSDDGGLSIGAATSLRSVATSPLVRARFGMLAHAAASVGKPRIPETATIGGNICLDSRCFYYNQTRLWKQSLARCHKDGGEVCHVVKGSDHCNALFVADTAPALIALGAEVTMTASDGERQVPLEDFYTGDGAQVNQLRPGEVLTWVKLPAPPRHNGSIYLKYSLREAIDFAVVGVAVTIGLEPEGGVCRQARIVLGSVATGPLRPTDAEAALRGKAIDSDLLATAVRLAVKGAHPVNHLGVSATYKRGLIETLTRRALEEAWRQAASA